MTTLLTEAAHAIGSSAAASLVVKATLTMALALLLVRLARRSRAAVRHVLLAGTFATLVLLPLASVILPPRAIDIPVVPAAIDAAQPALTVVMTAPQPVSAAAPRVPAGRAVAAFRLPPPTIVALAWSVAALLFLLPVVAGLWQTRALRRRSVPWLEGCETAQELARDAGLRRQVDVRLDDSLPGPMTCGVMRPVIALPADAQGWNGEELRRALIHELEHVRRGDWIVQCAARSVCALYWFHPLVWIGWRRLALEAERACDDAVVSRAEATAYAEQLVVLAQRLSGACNRPMLAMTGRHDLARRVRALLDSTQPRGRAGRSSVAVVSAAALSFVFAIAPLRAAQTQNAASIQNEALPAFEIASIRKNTSGENEQFFQRQPGGRFTVRNMPLAGIIQFAYQVQPFQLQGGPDWLRTDRFDIIAKAEGDSPATGPAEPNPVNLMLRTLLADRFELAIRKDVQELPIYELRRARDDGKPGAELRPASLDCVKLMAAARDAARSGAAAPALPPPTAGGCGLTMGFGTLRMGGLPISSLVNALPRLVQRVVVDRTGLTGAYDAELTFTPDPALPAGGGLPPGATPPPADPNAPSIFTALQEQLGLKLEASRGPVEVLVIESVERPTEN